MIEVLLLVTILVKRLLLVTIKINQDKRMSSNDYLANLKIYESLPHLTEQVLVQPVIKVVAPTGTGKTVGMSHHLLRQLTDNQLFKGKKILFSIPTIVCAKWQYDYTKKMMSDVSHLVGIRAGGEGENERDARLIFGTTQSITNMLMTMYQRKEALDDIILVIDEAHHPSSENYVLQGICNWLLSKGIPIHVIIASATPSEHNFVHLNDTYNITVEQPQQTLTIQWHHETTIPVGIPYNLDRNITLVCDKVAHIIQSTPETDNDIVIFASGEDVIEKLAAILEKTYPHVSVHSAYSGVSREELFLVNQREEKRKVIIGTNIIESGVTIDGLTHVIDMLRHKMKHVNNNGIENLVESYISQSSSKQRRGRVGRTRPGFYYPLCSSEDFEKLSPFIENEFYISPKHNHVISLISKNLPADEILMIEVDEYRLIIAELTELLLITSSPQTINPERDGPINPERDGTINPERDGPIHKITPLGLAVSKFPTSINTTVTLLRQKEMFPPTTKRNYNMLVYLTMMLALSETKKSIPNIYFIPAAIRRQGKDEKQYYIEEEFDKFRSVSEFGVLMKIFLNMCITARVDGRGKYQIYEWAKKEKIIGKYIDQSFRLFKQLYSLLLDCEFPCNIYHMQSVYDELYRMIDTYETITFTSQALLRGYTKALYHPSGYNYMNEQTTLTYKINDKSLAERPRDERIVAIQTIEIKTNKGSLHILSLYVPYIDIPIAPDTSDTLSRHFTSGPSRHFSNGPSRHFSNGPSRHFTNGPSRHFTNGPSRHFTNGPSRHFTNDTDKQSTTDTAAQSADVSYKSFSRQQSQSYYRK